MHGSRKFYQMGSNSDNVFLVDDGGKNPNTTLSGPLLTRQQNAN